MDGTRFDELSRRFATRQTRRSVLGLIGAAAASTLMRETADAAPKDEKPTKCYGEGSHCTNGKQCCSNICTNRQCAPGPGPSEECTEATDCAGVDGECQVRTCIGGICGIEHAPQGFPVLIQIDGDCQKNVCDGSGGIEAVIDDTDVPVVPDACLSGSCTNGVPGTTPHEMYAPCEANGGFICDGAGHCVVCIPGETQSCYSGPGGTEGVGVCQAGTQTCQDDGSGFSACLGQVLPSLERCNGLDDDCDGMVDEDIAGIGGPCTTGLPGICAQGTLQCQGGMTRCVPLVLPFTRSETCNGLDDDCDGLVDEGACPSPMECRSGDGGYGCCFPSGVAAGNCDQCCSGECIPLLNVCT